MLAAHQWAQRNAIADRPWLILGKGPSFAHFTPGVTSSAILALNHVARDVACDAALMMDFDVFDSAADAIARNTHTVLMPWRPHVNFRPSARTLADFVRDDPRLAALADEGRLVYFNADTAARQWPAHGEEPVTGIKFFSAEAALNILADNGVQWIRTLGVDGGAAYAPAFADLNEETLLANGRSSFDNQFGQFAKTLMRHRALNFGPADMQAPVRVFVGADETQILGARVLEFSIREHASISTRFEIIDNEGLPVPTDPQRRARTGFSFSRFKIPALCGHQGRAIYLDADMLVFTDIKALWSRAFEGAYLLHSDWPGQNGRAPQYSVMLLDCAALDWDAKALVTALDSGAFDYKALMHDFAMMAPDRKRAGLESEWNSLEHYEAGKTKLLHYTDMPTQPWVSNKNPNGELFYATLRRALDAGFITRAEIDAEIARGHVSPDFPQWAKLKPSAVAAPPARSWTAPFKRFAAQLREKQ